MACKKSLNVLHISYRKCFKGTLHPGGQCFILGDHSKLAPQFVLPIPLLCSARLRVSGWYNVAFGLMVTRSLSLLFAVNWVSPSDMNYMRSWSVHHSSGSQIVVLFDVLHSGKANSYSENMSTLNHCHWRERVQYSQLATWGVFLVFLRNGAILDSVFVSSAERLTVQSCG